MKLKSSFLQGQIPKSAIVVMYGSYSFSFLKKLPTVFQSICTIFHSHKQCMSDLDSLYPYLHWGLYFIHFHRYIVISDVVLIGSSLMPDVAACTF